MGSWQCQEVVIFGKWPSRGCQLSYLINKDFLNRIILDFDGDDHGVILLVVEAVEVVIGEYDGGHAASVVGMGDMVDGLYIAEVSLSGGQGGASTCEATRDGINSAS